jgi:hypothetical protein
MGSSKGGSCLRVFVACFFVIFWVVAPLNFAFAKGINYHFVESEPNTKHFYKFSCQEGRQDKLLCALQTISVYTTKGLKCTIRYMNNFSGKEGARLSKDVVSISIEEGGLCNVSNVYVISKTGMKHTKIMSGSEDKKINESLGCAASSSAFSAEFVGELGFPENGAYRAGIGDCKSFAVLID